VVTSSKIKNFKLRVDNPVQQYEVFWTNVFSGKT